MLPGWVPVIWLAGILSRAGLPESGCLRAGLLSLRIVLNRIRAVVKKKIEWIQIVDCFTWLLDKKQNSQNCSSMASPAPARVPPPGLPACRHVTFLPGT